jgi:hypothetical protein
MRFSICPGCPNFQDFATDLPPFVPSMSVGEAGGCAMRCPVCGRANAESVSGTVSRSWECLDCSDSDQRPTADYTESTASQALAAPAPTTDVSPTGASHRASGPNAWTRSLERIQLRCAVLAKEAARDRAARVAQRGRVASELTTFEPPTLELTESKPPPSGRLN